jgi:hypothetical protein
VDEPSNNDFKLDLANRFVYFPLVRLLIFSFWFRLIFAGFLLFLVFLALFLPRIWRTTTPGFLPVIKISGLDMAQAWSLRRSALRSTKAGDLDQAAYAWQAAVAHNPANPELVRGALRHVLQLDRPGPKHQSPAVGQAFWLLRLTGTNAADVELVSRVYEKFQRYDLLLGLLAPRGDRLTAAEEAAYLKALFHSGQMAPFASRWERLKGRPFIAHDLELYHDAYLAGWGPPSTAGEGQRRLEAALANPKQAILANRLQLFVCARLNDADRYLGSLLRLEQAQSDTLLEHAVYWRLLAALGRQEEARTLLRSSPRPPSSAAEALLLAEIQVALGLRAEARQFLEQCTPQFGNAQDIWLRRAALLQEDQRWEDLRELALQLRQHPRMRDALAGYSYFLEGCAELGLDRPAMADIVFRKVAQHPVENRALALSTATSLLKLGYAAVARDLLLPLEQDFGERADYWHELLGAAYQLKEPSLMATAAAASYRLNPGNVACANNYTATLLVNRDRPEEAVSLTLQILSRFPDSKAAKINHALALLLNQRTDEAEAVLKSIVPEKLSGQEANSFYLGWFEVSCNQKQYDHAWEASDRIAAKYLFPNQLKWLEEMKQRLPRRTVAK